MDEDKDEDDRNTTAYTGLCQASLVFLWLFNDGY